MRARVLVVEDDDADRRSLCAAVALLGHEVRSAPDGEAALTLIAEDPDLDVVLLAMVMPGLPCSVVLTTIKADPGRRHLPVIVVSAVDDSEDLVRSIELGATDHLTKPVRAPLLAARLGASLAQKRLRDTELDHLRQVDRIIAAAESVQAGDYGTSGLDTVADREDRLGTLARVFRQMAGQVRQREKALRSEVAELRIEIDRSRLRHRVAEVTDSEHFRRLADQAADLRAIIAGPGEGRD